MESIKIFAVGNIFAWQEHIVYAEGEVEAFSCGSQLGVRLMTESAGDPSNSDS